MNFHFHVFLSCVISRYANCVCSFVYFKHWQPYIYIYIKNCWVRLLSYYNIKYICTIYTRLDTCLMFISRFSLRDKVTLRLLKLYFYIAYAVEWWNTWINIYIYINFVLTQEIAVSLLDIYIYIYIRLKTKPNSVRIWSLSCQIFVFPSTGFILTPLIHCSTNRLALCPAH
jgi:hypothetical protein